MPIALSENLGLPQLIIGFSFNLVVTFLIVRFLYFPKAHAKTHVFTFMAFNSVIFILVGPMLSAELSLGVGFGLFAVFSIIRYRTESLPVREMTYLFVVIAMPLVNGILVTNGLYQQAIAINILTVGALFLFETGWGFGREESQVVTYDRLKLIQPDRQEELVQDLRERTGLPITRCKIGRINLARKTANITIFFSEYET